MPSGSWTEKLKFWKIFWMRFPDFANMGFAFLNGINTSSDRRSKDTLKVITTDIFRFPGNPSHECTRSERTVCEKLQSFQILKLQVYQREKMNKHSAKSQITQHSISTANKKKSFTITTVSFFNKMDFEDGPKRWKRMVAWKWTVNPNVDDLRRNWTVFWSRVDGHSTKSGSEWIKE